MSLATKYRPKTLDEVYGHDAQKSALEQAITTKGVRSFIFDGPSGVGKTTMARIAAEMCSNARAQLSGTRCAFIEVDAASNSGVEAMRDLVQRTRYKPFGARNAVILDEAHRLSAQAWDVLLKPLEEDPSTIWIFCTTDGRKIPKTIRSRCMTLLLDPLTKKEVLSLLAKIKKLEKLSVTKTVGLAVADAAHGSARRGISLLEQVAGLEDEQALEFLDAQPSVSKNAKFLGAMIHKGEPLADILRELKAMDYGPTDGEGLRIQVLNYLTVVALNSTSEIGQLAAVEQLAHFCQPYPERVPSLPNFLVSVYECL